MSLPIRTTPDDIKAICQYLATKPTGATLAEAKAVLPEKIVVGRKFNALMFWGFIENDGNKYKITSQGREYLRDSGAYESQVTQKTILEIPPYRSVVERIVYSDIERMNATEVGAYWYEHFKEEASNNDRTLSDQAVCFFHLAEKADLGRLVVGRKGNPTRFEFELANAREFISQKSMGAKQNNSIEESSESETVVESTTDKDMHNSFDKLPNDSNKVFISHGKNKNILEQLKELVAYGKFEPIVTTERETAAKSISKKVMDDMRKCKAAVIHVSSDEVLADKDGNNVPQINANVLIEVGAAMALYDEKFILLVEEGVNLPSNLQGLYECRYQGDELTMTATMKLLKAFNEF